MASTAEDLVRIRKGEGGEVGERASERRKKVAGRRSGRIGKGEGYGSLHEGRSNARPRDSPQGR